MPVTENAVVVLIVAFVPSVEFDVGGVGRDVGRQLELIIVDVQRTARVRADRAVVVLDGHKRPIRRFDIATGAGHQGIAVVIVDANADVMDMIALVTPESHGVCADIEFGLIDLYHVGRAAPVGADGRMIDVLAIIDLEHRRLGIVVAPQVEIDFDLDRIGEVIRQRNGERLRAFGHRVRLDVP